VKIVGICVLLYARCLPPTLILFHRLVPVHTQSADGHGVVCSVFLFLGGCRVLLQSPSLDDISTWFYGFVPACIDGASVRFGRPTLGYPIGRDSRPVGRVTLTPIAAPASAMKHGLECCFEWRREGYIVSQQLPRGCVPSAWDMSAGAGWIGLIVPRERDGYLMSGVRSRIGLTGRLDLSSVTTVLAGVRAVSSDLAYGEQNVTKSLRS